GEGERVSLNAASFDLAALRALMNACRDEGVMSFSSPEVSFVLGPKPIAPPKVDGETKPSADEELEKALFEVGQV
ncbi:hypothetical protein ACXWOM_09725, partial [Streptococcus pyogenes]